MFKFYITTILILSVIITNSYILKSTKYINRNTIKSTWQEDFDKLVDIDTACDSRPDIASNLLRKLDVIGNDVFTAITERNIDILAPGNLTYGKNLIGAKAFKKQLINDIIPDFLTQQLPKLITELPNITQKLTTNPSNIIKQGEEIINKVNEISKDPSALQSTVDDLEKEIKNIFKSTPVGLYTPPFVVLKSTSNYEIRKYNDYSVASTTISNTGSNPESDIIASGNSFNELAGYILSGENENNEKLSMTTPVIMGNGKMQFVLPPGLNASTAPRPNSDKIFREDINSEIVAVREFSGLPTEKEISKQRAILEDNLLLDGIIYDNLSFKTLTYNPPYTLPWLRRNEVSLKVEFNDYGEPHSEIKPVDKPVDTPVTKPVIKPGGYDSNYSNI